MMATAGRARELAALRLAGATRAQVLRLVGAEALAVAGAGALLGLLVAVLNLLGMTGALALLSAPARLALPWPALAATAGACALVAVAAAVLAAARTLRRT
jgi:putative ABC transport system permease protein